MRNLLEHKLRQAGQALAEYQVARFWKIPEEFSKTPCDFMGYTSSGRAILIEAKQVNRMSLPIGGTPGLAPHQFLALDEANRVGAIAILCWMRSSILASLSWDLVLTLSKDRKSVPWSRIPKKYMRPVGLLSDPTILLEPWLSVR